MKKLFIFLALAVVLNGCGAGSNTVANTKDTSVRDISDQVTEVCIKGITYYKYSPRVDVVSLAPKMVNSSIPAVEC